MSNYSPYAEYSNASETCRKKCSMKCEHALLLDGGIICGLDYPTGKEVS